ncbi:ABC transporter ATP-binding protein [Noviherbaspirillum cavernae]|uniref:ABC transporter ATP-binding protein n=1 Tax=Noviherbaspirillum cavernae TaxID=2320862 RepID=A0A418WX12_9BURK|nr:ABC transporter ATP-binding protein [Noviherbaspirillum cavernae]RJG04779.1 ABC transporter ATP-binding protein [Noviherbaspirillum cavernae]
MSGATRLLSVQGLGAGYGDIAVLNDISFDIDVGDLVALIGSNGAGKSTLLRTLSGVIKPSVGKVQFNGEELCGVAPEHIVAAGLIHVPEGRRLFAGLSVVDNLLVGAYLRRDGKAAIRRSIDEVYSLFPRLAERRHQDAATLSGGEQQMCAIGRGLMANPRLLLIDELSLGLAPRVVDELIAAMHRINARGTTLLVVEQDVEVALSLARHGLVLDQGSIRLSGESSSLRQHPLIHAAYLGEVL